MPNIKIYVTKNVLSVDENTLKISMDKIVNAVCVDLNVPREKCQAILVPMVTSDDQPSVSVELAILPSPDRSHQVVERLGRAIQKIMGEAVGLPCPIRATWLDSARYMVLRPTMT